MHSQGEGVPGDSVWLLLQHLPHSQTLQKLSGSPHIISLKPHNPTGTRRAELCAEWTHTALALTGTNVVCDTALRRYSVELR